MQIKRNFFIAGCNLVKGALTASILSRDIQLIAPLWTPAPVYDAIVVHRHGRLYGIQTHTSRRPLFSSALASAGGGSRPRLASNEVFALFMARSTCRRSLAAMTHVLAVPRVDSRTAACSRGSFDGSERDYFFPRMISVFATRTSNQAMQPTPKAFASRGPTVSAARGQLTTDHKLRTSPRCRPELGLHSRSPLPQMRSPCSTPPVVLFSTIDLLLVRS